MSIFAKTMKDPGLPNQEGAIYFAFSYQSSGKDAPQNQMMLNGFLFDMSYAIGDIELPDSN